MKVKVYTVSSFTKTVEGGNPAGVVLAADALSESDMKRIAAIVGYSETAYVLNSDVADFKVRFFTPNEEVDLCGHATIAAFHTLFDQGCVQIGTYSQETKAGILHVELREDSSVMMNQNEPNYFEKICRQEIADSLNITADQMPEDLPVQIVSTGLRDILVPVKNLVRLSGIKPDFEKVAAVSRKYNAIGYHIFTLESINGSTAHCRNLAPLYGIREESATGTSNGALACYLFHYGKIDPEHTGCIVMEQGYSMNKPSEIIAALTVHGKEIVEVKVGGKAVNLSEIAVEL